MSTILMAMLIIAITIILPWIFIARHKINLKKQARENFLRFSNAGSARELSFSRQEIIQNKIIGFDGKQQVLMIAELDNDYDITCIAIKELTKCTIDKIYHTAGDSAPGKEKTLKEIRLSFYFLEDRQTAHVLFYDSDKDNIYLMADMEIKAKSWHTTINKLIPKYAGSK